MKYCKNCHLLYSSEAAVCPKCGAVPEPQEAEPAPADRREVRRDWIWLVVGIPVFIAFVYLLVRVIKAI